MNKEYAKLVIMGRARRLTSLLECQDDKQLKFWMRAVFPDMTKEEHLVRAYFHRQCAANCEVTWLSVVQTEFYWLFKRTYRAVTDYHISGIAREEFDRDTKEYLRKIVKDKTGHRYAAKGHAMLSGKTTASALKFIQELS